ncbi:exonuclease domain-containing protein [bacterium]|nr:exonuclease domain-containing protein [bacterium]
MNYIVVDIEATCWDRDSNLEEQEIIEIGAIKLNGSFEQIDEYDSFIRPVKNPQLSEFCKNLTQISQCDVEKAHTFDIVFPKFVQWIGDGPYSIITWGAYDIKHLKFECKLHSVKFPKIFEENHINLKLLFAKYRKIKACGMKAALKMMYTPLEGVHHRGIDDARNIAKIARILLKDEV